MKIWRVVMSLAVGVIVVLASSGPCTGAPERKAKYTAPLSSASRRDSLAGRCRSQSLVYVTPTVTVYYDQYTNTYYYTYVVYNSCSSQNNLETFAVTPCYDGVDVSEPSHWSAFQGYQRDGRAVVWTVTDNYPDYQWDGLHLPESPYNTPPCSDSPAFVIASHVGPGTVQYYAQGYEPIADEGDDEDDFLPPTPTIYQAGATGWIQGPNSTPAGVADSLGGWQGEPGLKPASPNPAAGQTMFGFALPLAADVSLVVHDVAGREVRRVLSGHYPAGLHSTHWNGMDERGASVPAGVYYCRFEVNGKMVSESKVVIFR